MDVDFAQAWNDERQMMERAQSTARGERPLV